MIGKSPAEYNEQPGILNLILGSNNILDKILTFSIDLTGYTFESYVFLDSLETNKIEIKVNNINLSDGKINIFCDKLSPLLRDVETYRWLLRWTDNNNIDRVVLEGSVKII